MASGLVGKGRLVEPAELLGHIRLVLGRHGPLTGKKIMVTAGGTQEPLDPVRVLTNRSSGKQGYAVAQAALDAGGSVVLITTPTGLTHRWVPGSCRSPPPGKCWKRLVRNRPAHTRWSWLLRWRISARSRSPKDKLKKRDGIPQVELGSHPDILATMSLAWGRKSHGWLLDLPPKTAT